MVKYVAPKCASYFIRHILSYFLCGEEIKMKHTFSHEEFGSPWYWLALTLMLGPLLLWKVITRHPSQQTTPKSRHGQRTNARRSHPGNIPPRDELAYLFDDECEAMRYLMDYEILNTHACPFCGTENPEPKWKSPWPEGMTVLPHRACLTLRCGKDGTHCWSPFRGTFFSKCRKPANKVLELVYCWACRLSITQTSKVLRIYRGTVSQYFKYFCEVCMAEVILLSQHIQLGGPGCLVEMDESKFGKRKYHRGRRVEGNWVWGAIKRVYNPETGRYEAGECVMVVVPDRTAETLTKLIKRFIKPGSLIISDMWKAYQKIGEWKSPEVQPLSNEMHTELFGSFDTDDV